MARRARAAAKTHDHAYTDRTAGAKPGSGAVSPAAGGAGLAQNAGTWPVQRTGQQLFGAAWSDHRATLEQYRGTKEAATLEKLSMWDDIADKDIAEKTFTDSLNHMFDSLLELRQEELIARDRTHGLSSEERRELWTISQELAKK
jgi:DNA primase